LAAQLVCYLRNDFAEGRLEIGGERLDVSKVDIPAAPAGANLFFWTTGAMNGSTKVQSS
jgi:hypothetical protein